MFTVGIITASDKGSQGIRLDESGRVIRDYVEAKGDVVVEMILIPDEQPLLEEAMIHLSDEKKVNLILTTGGTGFSKRDVTPEATKNIMTKEASGIAEAIRFYSLSITPRAMLSRGVSVIRGETLIINLPGSPKAVKEALDFIYDTLHHGLEILLGTASECARKEST